MITHPNIDPSAKGTIYRVHIIDLILHGNPLIVNERRSLPAGRQVPAELSRNKSLLNEQVKMYHSLHPKSKSTRNNTRQSEVTVRGRVILRL